ncbi:Group II intron, maturase-specific domain protein, partial [Acididesulfobacillus acetoxydans]
QRHITEGFVYVVDMDLEKYFDTVNQSKLIQILSDTIKDGRVISLIHKFLRAGIMVDGLFEESPEGVPQGGPLSPLLGNVMLNVCDHELEKRGHRFVRYADDMMIFCKSEKAARRTLDHIVPYIEGKLFLRVNKEKTSVAHVRKVKYLGYGFYIHKGRGRLRIH